MQQLSLFRSMCNLFIISFVFLFLLTVFYVDYWKGFMLFYSSFFVLNLFIQKKFENTPKALTFLFSQVITPMCLILVFLLSFCFFALKISISLDFLSFLALLITYKSILIIMLGKKARAYWSANVKVGGKKGKKKFDLDKGILDLKAVTKNGSNYLSSLSILFASVGVLTGKLIGVFVADADAKAMVVILALLIAFALIFSPLYVSVIYPFIKIFSWQKKENKKMIVARG